MAINQPPQPDFSPGGVIIGEYSDEIIMPNIRFGGRVTKGEFPFINPNPQA